MPETQTPPLEEFIRRRSRELGRSLSEICRRAAISRQTLYEFWQYEKQYPSLQTVVALATTLEVHPLLLLRYLFAEAPVRDPLPITGDQSSFIRDVTYADNALVLVNEPFRKIWSIQNTGTVPWEGRKLRCMDETLEVFTREGDQLSVAPPLQPVATEVPVPYTPSGETVELAADFVAPPVPGSVISYWKMVDAEERVCFPDAIGLWVRLQVVHPASGAD